MYKGVAVSPGVAVGVAYRIESALGPTEPQFLSDAERIPAEIARFDKAVTEAAIDVGALYPKSGPAARRFRDRDLSGPSSAHQRRGASRPRSLADRDPQVRRPHRAPNGVSRIRRKSRRAANKSIFRERLADFRDIIQRIISHLAPSTGAAAGTNGVLHSADAENNGDDPIIIVTHELLPSQALSFGDSPIAGIVTETGGGTSHAAILSRSRGIPAVSGVVGITALIANGDPIIVDGRDGVVVVRPDPETTAAYRKMQREFFDLKDRLVSNKDLPSITADGARIELLTNINNVADAEAAQMVGADGVGLYRTEFLFLSHQDVPDEEEQYEYYKKIIESSPANHVTIRTLDLGGDKTVPYLGRKYEANPFMGWRSIRLSFEHPRLFEQQIRAILRAGRHGRVSMLFPMITTLEELRHVNRLVEDARRSMRKEGMPFGENVRTGVMVEVPGGGGLHRRHPPRDRFHLDRDQRPDPVSARGGSRQPQGRTPMRAVEPGRLSDSPDDPRRLQANRHARDRLRRNGGPAQIGAHALGDGPAELQHEPRVHSDDQVAPFQGDHRAGRAVRAPRAPAQDQRGDSRYLTARLHEVASDLELFDFV